MKDHGKIEDILRKHGIEDFRWIDPGQIVVAQWVRMKCAFGCPEYGRTACCPPAVPSVAECERFFGEYTEAVVLRFVKKVDRPEARHDWTKGVNEGLLKVEREIFLAGFRKAFLTFMDTCCFCAECTDRREACAQPKRARPAPEALAVDVFATVRKVGYPIEVLSEYDQPMNRYGILLVD